MAKVESNKQDLESLKLACIEVAKTTHWGRKPIDSKDISVHADQLFEESLLQYDLVNELGGTIPLITRAVHYINRVHAIPPMKDDLRWFSESLRTLLELSCPNTCVDDISKLFLNDLQKGISESLSD